MNWQPSRELIVTREEQGVRVQCGDRYEDHLGLDEALWCVVLFLQGSNSHHLKTQAEHDAWNAKYCPKPLEAWQKQLPAVTNEGKVN